MLLVAALGTTALLAPLGGRSVPMLVGEGSDLAPSLALGIVAGVGSEVLRRAITKEDDLDVITACRHDSSLRAQKTVTYQVLGGCGVSPASVAAVLAWQIPVAVAEESYYRGFMQSGLQSGLSSIGAGFLVSDVVALFVASALFGAVHVLWVDNEGGQGSDVILADSEVSQVTGGSKFEWFIETGLWGLLYGSTFVAAGHNILAPVFAHASQNVWWCLEDAVVMGKAPPEVLEDLFGGQLGD